MNKLELEFFTTDGPSKLQNCNIVIFLDLKLYSIPNTISKTVKALKALGIVILTLHISDGTKMLKVI